MFEILTLLFLLLLVSVTFVFLLVNFYSYIVGAPYVPASKDAIATVLRLAELQGIEQVLDLGSGDGRVVRALAPRARQVTGIELNPMLVAISRIAKYLRQQRNTTFLQENFWVHDITTYDVIVIFCIAGKTRQLAKKLAKEAKPGAKILSVWFPLPNWQEQKKDGTVYLYNVPSV